MKKILLITALFFTLFAVHAHAKEYTFKWSANNTIKVSTSATNAIVSFVHTGNVAIQTTISVWKEKQASNSSLSGKIFEEPVVFDNKTIGTKSFTVKDLIPDTTYYVSPGGYPFQTEPFIVDPSTPITADTLKFESVGSVEHVSGKISNPQNYAYLEGYGVLLEYCSKSAPDCKQYPTDTTDPTLVNKSANGYRSHTDLDYSKGGEGINHDGTFYWTLSNIGPGNYWYRETFWDKDYKTLIGTPVVGTFNGKEGVVIAGSSEDQADFEKRSYRLLAPLPGLSVLLDPDLCQEKKNADPSRGQICDINDFLNYAFKLLIGLAAVVLVLRIIFEGYRYITTDVPFLKVEAKSKVGQAIVGLLLALSAYLILNTINPQLVANDINIPTISVNIDDYGDTAAPLQAIITDKLPAGVICPKSGGSDKIASIATSWENKVKYYLDGSPKNNEVDPNKGKSTNAWADGKARLDCSGFVDAVLSCAGYNVSGYDGTSGIFKNALQIKSIDSDTSVTVSDGTKMTLQPGDLLGYTSVTSGKKWGHVIIYVGSGQVMESRRVDGNVLPPKKLTQYKGKLTYLKRPI